LALAIGLPLFFVSGAFGPNSWATATSAALACSGWRSPTRSSTTRPTLPSHSMRRP